MIPPSIGEGYTRGDSLWSLYGKFNDVSLNDLYRGFSLHYRMDFRCR